MVVYTKVNGKKVGKMAEEYKYGEMVLITKVIGEKGAKTVKGD